MARSRAALLCSVLFVAFLFGGCDIVTRPSTGELGQVEYMYHHGLLRCVFGCDAEAPIAEGARVGVLILEVDELPAFTVSSDRPEVATFSYDEKEPSLVIAEATASGDVRLVLTAADGTVIDRLPFRVHPVRKVLLRSPDYIETVLIMPGGDINLSVELLDDEGEELVGQGGVTYTLYGQLGEDVVTLEEAIAEAVVGLLVGTSREHATVDALEPGEGSVEIRAASGVTLDIPIRVVDESAARRVELRLPEEPPVVGEPYYADVDVWAEGEERILDPVCDWSLSSQDGSVWVSSSGRDFVALGASGPGSATLTCTIGAVSDSVEVVFTAP